MKELIESYFQVSSHFSNDKIINKINVAQRKYLWFSSDANIIIITKP